MKDFTPTKEKISLHGLGFMQIKLPANRRMHIWHPDLPRRSCFEHSAIHNHRFSFRSTVLIGTQVNRGYMVRANEFGGHDRISHDGPRSEKGGRLSYVAERVEVFHLYDRQYEAGDSYIMQRLDYHATPNSGIVVTIMEKLEEGDVHASSLITHGQGFDRFQLSEDELWRLAMEALRS